MKETISFSSYQSRKTIFRLDHINNHQVSLLMLFQSVALTEIKDAPEIKTIDLLINTRQSLVSTKNRTVTVSAYDISWNKTAEIICQQKVGIQNTAAYITRQQFCCLVWLIKWTMIKTLNKIIKKTATGFCHIRYFILNLKWTQLLKCQQNVSLNAICCYDTASTSIK